MPIILDFNEYDENEFANDTLGSDRILRSRFATSNDYWFESWYRVSIQAALHDDCKSIYTIVRNGQEYKWKNDHPSYRICQCQWASILRQRESKIMAILSTGERDTIDDQIKLSGELQNMSYDEFMTIFNAKKSSCLELIAVDPESGKKNYDGLIAHIHQLEEALRILLVHNQASRSLLKDLEDAATEEEREEIRKKDKAYKVTNKANSIIDNAAKERLNKEQKLRKTFAGLQMSEEEIEQRILAMKTAGKL